MARLLPSVDKRLDWWDMREGPALNPDVTYPELPTAAAFACSTRLCSEPMTGAARRAGRVSKMLALCKDERVVRKLKRFSVESNTGLNDQPSPFGQAAEKLLGRSEQ